LGVATPNLACLLFQDDVENGQDPIALDRRCSMEMTKKSGFWLKLGIIWTIARKDIVDAIKNKIVLGVMLGTGILVLNSQLLGVVLRFNQQPRALIYDPAASGFSKSLTRSTAFRAYRVSSLEDLERALSEAAEPQLGLVMPMDFEAQAASGQEVQLSGYTVHWADPAQVSELDAFFEKALSQAAGVPVTIRTEGNVIYPSGNSYGHPYSTAMSIAIAILVIGIFLSPYLLLDEKEKHTMDALLVSPANFSEVVIGKALAGLFYCLVSAVVLYALNAYLVLHPGLFILGLFCGAVFSVGFGLLFGVFFDSPHSMNMWVGLIFIILLAPLLLGFRLEGIAPGWIVEAVSWLPSFALLEITRLAFVGPVDAGLVARYVLLLLGLAGLLLGIVTWRVKQMGR